MFTCAAKVDIGVSEAHNDDRLLIGRNVITDGTVSAKISDTFLLAAVCDGVGGMAKGYLAAEMTLKFLSFVHRKGTSADTIRNAIEEANRRVRAYQVENNLINGARTTISGIYADEDLFLTFNAGDSRVYRLRYKYVSQLTKDNSYVQDLIDLGELSVEEAKVHPKRNLINKCIGHEEKLNPKVTDLSGEFDYGDIIMICSDGISDVLTNKEIQTILYNHCDDSDLSDCCNEICEKAIANGSQDNMSVLLIRKDEDVDA
jgi:protein phosphatase